MKKNNFGSKVTGQDALDQSGCKILWSEYLDGINLYGYVNKHDYQFGTFWECQTLAYSVVYSSLV